SLADTYCSTLFTRTSSAHVSSSTMIYPLSLHDALPIFRIRNNVAFTFFQFCITNGRIRRNGKDKTINFCFAFPVVRKGFITNQRSEEHTSELQSRFDLVCRLLLEKKKKRNHICQH